MLLFSRSPSPLNKNHLPAAVQKVTPPTSSTNQQQLSDNPVLITKQQKIVLQQALSHSYGYYVSQASSHGNFLIPALPRFNDNGELIPMV
jgi:hypothetical protein